MRILAVDTSSASCSVGLLFKGRLMAEATSEKKETHSRHLMSLIHAVFEMAGERCNDLDLLAVVTGPGSFTGIRIGVSTVQGLAMALSKPVESVSSLEALAIQALPSPYVVCPILDARRCEVYMALYRYENQHLKQIRKDCVISPQRLLASIDEPCYFIGSGAQIYGELIQKKMGSNAVLAGRRLSKIRAETVGRIALKKNKARQLKKSESQIPHYIRPSDAELSAEKNRKSNDSQQS
jgi:tRNA threonylcarbamoyladenosine biosynthesis protein TsaB